MGDVLSRFGYGSARKTPAVPYVGFRVHNRAISNLASGLPAVTRNKLLFLWTGDFSGDNLLSDLDTTVITVTGKDFTTSYIPATSAATFAIPDNATYKGADTDNFWHSGSTILQKTIAQMVGTDNSRTFFKYADEAPHHITAFAIAKADAVFDSVDQDNLSKFFWLWLYYFGTLNDYGHLKENRPVEEDPYCPQFRAVYDSWTNKPSDLVATAMDTMVRALVDSGVWSKLDAFQLYAVHSNAAGEALKDWATLARTITTTNSPTFTAFQGFAGIIANSTRINTGFNGASSSLFTQNDNCIGVYNRLSRSANSSKVHGIQTAGNVLAFYLRSGGGNFIGHDNSLTGATAAVTGSTGFYIMRRDSSSQVDLWKNGSEIGANKTANSAARINQEMELLCLNNAGTRGSFSDEEISLFFAGAALSDAEITTLTNAFEAYMDSNSKGVIA